MEQLEKMSDFFAARVEMYDDHMINAVEGCKEGYLIMSDYVPENCRKLLDLGCGTGLELKEIYNRFPYIEVTGIDLCDEMLRKLREKYADKNPELICGDYFTEHFGEHFDCAVSFQTMHHFSKDKKKELYKKIHACLTDKGVYIECDYMVETQEEEDLWFSENTRLREAHGLDKNEYFHYDIPCTIENQIKLFKEAGFTAVEKVMQIKNTTMLVARK